MNILETANAIATRVFESHGCDGQSNKILRAIRAQFKKELPSATICPSTPVHFFLKEKTRARTFDEWNEDHGDVLWFRLPITEPPYVGSPLDLGFSVCAQLSDQFGNTIGVTQANVGGWPWLEADELLLRWIPIPVPEFYFDKIDDAGFA